MDDKLPLLMRQARKFLMKKSYADAIEAYRDILQCESMQDSVDMSLRLAWCYEQIEAWDDACTSYEHVVQMYAQQGEADAAQDLNEKIKDIRISNTQADDIIEPLNDPQTDEAMDFPDLLTHLKMMGDKITLAKDDVLCEAGETSDVLWLLEEGEMGVQLPDYFQDGEDVLTATDGLSVLIGELGLFTHQRRSAKVWAKQTSQLYQIKNSAIDNCPNKLFQLAMHELLTHYWLYPILSKHSIFERMNDVDRRALSHLFTTKDVQSGDCLIALGENHDGAYLLQQGCLFFVYTSETGGEQVSSMFPGDMVHLGGLLHAYDANYEVRAATDVRLLHLSRQNIEAFIKNRPWMVDVLLRYSRREAWRQVMRPDDAYLWMTNREIQQRHVRLTTDA